MIYIVILYNIGMTSTSPSSIISRHFDFHHFSNCHPHNFHPWTVIIANVINILQETYFADNRLVSICRRHILPFRDFFQKPLSPLYRQQHHHHHHDPQTALSSSSPTASYCHRILIYKDKNTHDSKLITTCVLHFSMVTVRVTVKKKYPKDTIFT